MLNETFHFLRPEWLWGLAGLPLILLFAQRRNISAGGWRNVCDADLLPHLLHKEDVRSRHWPYALMAVTWLASTLALAGPTWERLPEIAYHEPTQTIVVLQLTPSMHKNDIAPSRLERARYELQDLLDQSQGSIGLVIFAEEAYAVTPLTDDPRVIEEVVPTLETQLMPGRGSRVDRGITEAQTLLNNAGAGSGRIVLLVDGLGDEPDLALSAAREAAHNGHSVSVLALNQKSGSLTELANVGHGHFSEVLPDDRDITSILNSGGPEFDDFATLRQSEMEADAWKDAGLYLLWIPLLIGPLAFRRGWAGSLGIVLFLCAGFQEPAEASIGDWFSRPDQQAAIAFEEGRHPEAAAEFENPEWRGVAAYRSGQYEKTIESLNAIQEPRAQYNLGNAFAQSGQLEEAIRAYDEALRLDAHHQDALHNRELVANLLKQQEQEQEQEQDKSESKEDQESSESSGSDSPSDSQEDSGGSEEQTPGETEASPDSSDSKESAPTQQKSKPHSEESDSKNSASEGSDSSHGNQPSQERSKDLGSQAQKTPKAESNPQDDIESQNTETSDAESDSRRDSSSLAEEKHKKQNNISEGPVASSSESPMSEEDQEVEQWLSRVPDDPGGLLREKLRRRYAEKQNRSGLLQGERRWQ